MPLGLPLLLGAGLIVGWALLVLFTCWLLSHPPRRTYANAVARNLPGDPSEITVDAPDGTPRRGLSFSEWTFRSRGIDLPVWDVQGLNASGPIIIFSHGWGDSRVLMLPRIAALAPHCSRLIAWDLPAHGDAPRGRFSLGAHEPEDLQELFARVVATPNTRDTPIFLYGFSLGATVTIAACSRIAKDPSTSLRLPRGAILEAPYRVPATPAGNVLRMRGMPYRSNLHAAMWLLMLRYGPAFRPAAFDRAHHQLHVPACVVHATLDAICPIDDARAIASANPGCEFVAISGGSHNTLWTDPATSTAVLSAILRFLSTHAGPSTESTPTSRPAAAGA